ncbi:hypothetical protein PspLS_05048 [Pyricularia sp. CBS 133598]|nr:hypothetical protein PspLS_05048 [Pyricularia sp. CBS 133598]
MNGSSTTYSTRRCGASWLQPHMQLRLDAFVGPPAPSAVKGSGSSEIYQSGPVRLAENVNSRVGGHQPDMSQDKMGLARRVHTLVRK